MATREGELRPVENYSHRKVPNSSGFVRAQKEHAILVDNGDAKAVKPAGLDIQSKHLSVLALEYQTS